MLGNKLLVLLCVVLLFTLLLQNNYEGNVEPASISSPLPPKDTKYLADVETETAVPLPIHTTSSLDNPACDWKPGYELVGTCVGTLKTTSKSRKVTTAEGCAALCCSLPVPTATSGAKDDTSYAVQDDVECIAWQFRSDIGCQIGGDHRIGMEKDGPGSWCEKTAPSPWQGHRVAPKNRQESCAGTTWNNTLPGQCFGFGPQKQIQPDTAAQCRKECCADAKCETWQFRDDKGCYFGGKMSKCEKGDSVAMSPFQGQRKRLASRTYEPPK
eukprot:m.538352 g.538352  ORF g.538352 m.538352 type:complete len:270 (+) comp22083_c0_seq4:176-985(+)